MDNAGQCQRSCALSELLLITFRRALQAGGRALQASDSSARTPCLSLPEKHFPRVWQPEKNKRLLFAGRCNASHNTQLTAYSPMIHSQELGVSEIIGGKKISTPSCPRLQSCFRALFWQLRPDTFAHFLSAFQNKLSEL